MFRSVKRSLRDMLSAEYLEMVEKAAINLHDMNKEVVIKLSRGKIEFLPVDFIEKMERNLYKVGQRFLPEIENSLAGASTKSFKGATSINASPISGLGYLRLGEDGRLYLISKSEHYHAVLGHSFPGYDLIDNARRLGITNITHNNTRGHITRYLETELIRVVNGLDKEDQEGLLTVIKSKEPLVLNRVINLETGSLAAEAAMKMMLSRFYNLDNGYIEPKYYGRTPVFFVMGDEDGGYSANYHGTTIFAQILRGLWTSLYKKMEQSGEMMICPLRINNFEDFQTKFHQYNQAPYKVVGFLHELILMNYGAIRLKEDYLQKAYKLCHSNDTPVLIDEIQSCMWYPKMFLFKEYGLDPDFVAIGKGFPGGQYPASRIITTFEMDNLSQFGALVTNGQEELASLAYLITMEFASENAEHTRETGAYYETRLVELALQYPSLIDRIEGKAHLSAVYFHDVKKVEQFVKKLHTDCIDISAQTYKAKCPPAALTKLPIISTKKMVDYLIDKMRDTLKMIIENKLT